MTTWRRAAATAATLMALGFAGTALAATPDAWITTKAKMALLTTDGVSSTAVNVDTIDGRVTLHGTVSSEQEKAKAEQAVRQIKGVTEVRNLLAVVAPSRQDAVAVADDQIEKNVASALDKDNQLDDSSIKVASVNDGAVVLSGTAQTLSDQLRAIEVARSVPGVKRVASEMTGPSELTDAEIWRDSTTAAKQAGNSVGQAAKDTGNAVKDAAASTGSAISDAWITSAAKVRLMANSNTPSMDINVDTRDGAVTLFGMVPTDAAKRAAETEVKQVSGVRTVDNQLRIVAEAKQDTVEAKDDEIKARVDERLEKALSDDDIGIEVTDGVVRLTGTVDSQGERLQALTVARGTAGVRSVIDGLTVDTGSEKHAASQR